MDSIARSNDRITFKPAAGWQWQGWSGELPLKPASRSLAVNGKDWVVDEDILKLNQELMGKAYVASGFDAAPGTVVVASITIEQSTLSQTLTLQQRKVALVSTTGSFRLSVVPSMNSAPSPDPMTTKTGRFTIKAQGPCPVQG